MTGPFDETFAQTAEQRAERLDEPRPIDQADADTRAVLKMLDEGRAQTQ